MATPPGSVGFPVVGDKSVEFYKDAAAFVEKRMLQYSSRVFQARFLTKPTVFLGSNTAVHQLLNDCSGNVDFGYKSFMHQVYGDNILFEDGSQAAKTKEALRHLFSHIHLTKYKATIERLVQEDLKNLLTFEEVEAYEVFKCLMTKICLTLFLGLDFQDCEEIAKSIVDLTTIHWHGIISVPLSLRIPGIMSSSTYRQSLEAKEKLLDIIRDRMKKHEGEDGFLKWMSEANFPSAEHAYNHVLLLTSALAPKALASLLTSFIITTARSEKLQDDARDSKTLLQNIWLEVYRLHPPFAGGRRLVRRDCEVDGHQLTAGQACMYMTRAAQRDPQVFTDPHEFMPSRWHQQNAGDQDKLFLFGGGIRKCMGEELVHIILQTCSKYLLENYNWSLVAGQDLTYKWLPVSRPKEGVKVRFKGNQPKTECT